MRSTLIKLNAERGGSIYPIIIKNLNDLEVRPNIVDSIVSSLNMIAPAAESETFKEVENPDTDLSKSDQNPLNV
jgi:hypothetical protein